MGIFILAIFILAMCAFTICALAIAVRTIDMFSSRCRAHSILPRIRTCFTVGRDAHGRTTTALPSLGIRNDGTYQFNDVVKQTSEVVRIEALTAEGQAETEACLASDGKTQRIICPETIERNDIDAAAALRIVSVLCIVLCGRVRGRNVFEHDDGIAQPLIHGEAETSVQTEPSVQIEPLIAVVCLALSLQ
ncbi:MAG: hypothetical protein E6813_32590 [Bradyrhizobium sp.]|nr:hypothetical protein [Bradyrhizobium sp.]MDU6668202.1 hypothetical protein [Bradyrhizobium sp.]